MHFCLSTNITVALWHTLEFCQSFQRLAARSPTLPLSSCINNGNSKKFHFKSKAGGVSITDGR